MPKATQGLGLFLILLGIGAYAYSGGESVTALIPAFFGLPIGVSGFLAARYESKRALWMHIAVVLAVVGVLGTARGVIGFAGMLGGAETARPAAVVVQTMMALACAVYVVAAVRSFIAARRAEASS